MAHRTLAFRCALTQSAKWPTAFLSHLCLARRDAARDGRR